MVLRRIVYFMMVVFILTACSATVEEKVTSEEILNKVEEEHDAIESVFVNEEVIEHLDDTLSYIATEEIDFKNGVISYDIEEGQTKVYKDKDGVMIILDGEHVDPDLGYDEVQDFRFSFEMGNQKNPLKQLKKFDDNFYDSLTMKENKGSYAFTYKGDEEQSRALIQGIVWSNHIQANSLADSYENLDIGDAELEITALVNKKTNRIKMFKINIKYSPPEEFGTPTIEYTTINTYSKYNEIEAIEKPEVVANDLDTNSEEVTMSDEEVAKAEQEASDYVDALIQATVFQDVEKYVDKAPGPQTEDEKREDGSLQQTMFRDIYERNTMENMKESGVTEKQVTDFAAAFMKALSVTTYEMADSKMVSDDAIQVTVSARGFDDVHLNLEVEKVLIEEHEAGKIEETDLLNRNVELIIEAYNSNEDLLKASEAVVDVMRNEDGTYMVLFQDQYLQAFVH